MHKHVHIRTIIIEQSIFIYLIIRGLYTGMFLDRADHIHLFPKCYAEKST